MAHESAFLFSLLKLMVIGTYFEWVTKAQIIELTVWSIELVAHWISLLYNIPKGFNSTLQMSQFIPVPKSQLNFQESCKPIVNIINSLKLATEEIFTIEIGKCYKAEFVFFEELVFQNTLAYCSQHWIIQDLSYTPEDYEDPLVLSRLWGNS